MSIVMNNSDSYYNLFNSPDSALTEIKSVFYMVNAEFFGLI